MSEQFHIYFESEAAAKAGESVLAGVHVDGKPAMLVRRDGRGVMTGCNIFSEIADDAVLFIKGSHRSAKFYDIFYQPDCLKSGRHHPDGIFWVGRPNGHEQVYPGRLPLTEVAPMILRMFGLEIFVRPEQARPNLKQATNK
jgi:hypothetical protein